MKLKYKYRKKWQDIANQLGMQDKQNHVATTDPTTKQDYMILVNNHRRFVKGMCNLSLEEQRLKLQVFADRMEELKQAQKEAKIAGEAELTNLVTKPEGATNDSHGQ